MNRWIRANTSRSLRQGVQRDRQDVDLSVAAQLRALRNYAQANGYVVAREYVDEAESGRVADRPQFRMMIEEGGKSKPESTEGRPWGQPLKKLEGAPLNLG